MSHHVSALARAQGLVLALSAIAEGAPEYVLSFVEQRYNDTVESMRASRDKMFGPAPAQEMSASASTDSTNQCLSPYARQAQKHRYFRDSADVDGVSGRTSNRVRVEVDGINAQSIEVVPGSRSFQYTPNFYNTQLRQSTECKDRKCDSNGFAIIVAHGIAFLQLNMFA
ncbi:hypothetical protein EDB83DRAFT_2554253 [Lactarius deliciosus]|nr:hypothetical protein EDB83DRAFT_2554253 [Lactarius deliciosus]